MNNHRAPAAVFPEFSLSLVREIFSIFLVNFTPHPIVMTVETFVFLLYIQCSVTVWYMPNHLLMRTQEDELPFTDKTVNSDKYDAMQYA